MGCTIHITISKNNFKEMKKKDVDMDVVLTQKYPFQSPRIFLRTNFIDTEIIDGRDLLLSILEDEWVPSKTIHDIVLAAPKLIDTIYKKARDGMYLKDLGCFHLGDLYDPELFLNHSKPLLTHSNHKMLGASRGRTKTQSNGRYRLLPGAV
eukprot:TRINITY_DN7516_c0_g3_i2.p2 TRINITY_DN7516_c0_g3~~TRINITY_DN7516_c0_g3_i2.p2  ORF type:complete len:151 (+),score=18.92 TRINITY_DN7516_c0_g3_i2:282-734(+)